MSSGFYLLSLADFADRDPAAEAQRGPADPLPKSGSSGAGRSP